MQQIQRQVRTSSEMKRQSPPQGAFLPLEEIYFRKY
jgi:hypothetical protein